MDSKNPISNRIDILVDKWNNFRLQESGRICIWQIEPEENSLIERFIEEEETPVGQTEDAFLRFYSPFENEKNHGLQLLEELDEQLKAHQEFFGEEAAIKNWTPLETDPAKQFSPNPFIQNLKNIRENLEEYGGFLVAWLIPESVRNQGKYNEWLMALMEAGVPENLRLMLVDTSGGPQFASLAKAFPKAVIPIKADLNMPGAMHEIAAAGDPTQPGVKFQHLFIDLSQAVKKGNMRQAGILAEKALGIARAQHWLNLQVAVYIHLGSAWTARSDFDKAIDAYEHGRKVAENACEANDPMGPALLIQSLFAKASAYYARPDLKKAMETYEEAIPIAEANQDFFSLMEAGRMAGYCAESMKDHERAWDFNQLALDTAPRLEESICQNSTLPYIGDALLRICRRLGKNDQEVTIRQRLEEYVGPGWESKIEKDQRVKP